MEAIPVLAARLEPDDLDVHAVPQLRPRDRRPLLHDGAERPVGAHLPADFDVGHRHAAAVRAVRAPAASTARRRRARDRLTRRRA